MMVLADFMNRANDLMLERRVERMARATERSEWAENRESFQKEILELRRANRRLGWKLEELKEGLGTGTDKINDKNGDMSKEIS